MKSRMYWGYPLGIFLNHVKRLKGLKKFQEATKGLSDYQVQELEKLRRLVAVEAVGVYTYFAMYCHPQNEKSLPHQG